ncbi:MAG: hypothetical protein HZA35_04005 [Parcubacteria group bacterium]|nr:hypothetical protein [Parcubacteria group bacterium]
MKSPEGFTSPQTKIEEAKGEITPKSLKIEGIEISNEQLGQHIASVESRIGQRVAEILPEGEKRIESFVKNLHVLPETLDTTRREFRLDLQLREVQTEANQLANEAKTNIDTIVTKDFRPQSDIQHETLSTESPSLKPEAVLVTEVKEKISEELKKERRMEIIKELEKEWEIKNGPMERPLSKKEIEENRYRAERFGETWDGRTTQMTEKANEFFFDHRGMGKSSVPSRADKMLAERFPEYAEKIELPSEKERTEIGNSGKEIKNQNLFCIHEKKQRKLLNFPIIKNTHKRQV